jgi:hypothetical protein
MEIEQRELFATSVKSSGELKNLDMIHKRQQPDPSDLRKSLYSANPEVLELAKEEVGQIMSDITQNKKENKLKSIDMAILKNEAFKQLQLNDQLSSVESEQ